MFNFLKIKNNSFTVKSAADKIVSSISVLPRKYFLNQEDFILKLIKNNTFILRYKWFPTIKTHPNISSILYVEVLIENKGNTIVETTLKTSTEFYFSLIISLALGAFNVYTFITHKQNFNYLLSSVFLILIIPFLLTWYKDFTDNKMMVSLKEYIVRNL